MTPPYITVLINTHNYGHLIEEAVDSVLSQDFPLDEVEVLVVDDGSTDDTAGRIKSYGSRIRYLYKPNGGQASALNAGIANARGEIVALMDADDLFLPGKLAKVSEAFQQDPRLGMVYHPLLEWNLRTNERRHRGLPLVSGDMRKEPERFFSYIPHPTSCIALRRGCLGPLLPIPEEIRMMADCFLVQLIPLLAPIMALPDTLVLYRIHGKNNASFDTPDVPIESRRRQYEENCILFDAMRRWLAKNGYSYWQKHPPVRSFLDRWYIHQKSEEFRIDPPSRLRFFRFLIRQNFAYSPVQSWKLTTFNYLAAFAALPLGYDKWNEVYKWRCKVLEITTEWYRRFSGHSSIAAGAGRESNRDVHDN
jgi:glycosyltransferase involved in cell wall biosynthesis